MTRAILAALLLTGCAPLATLPPPSAVANATTLDEQGALGVELAYQAAALAALTANRAGLVPVTARPDILKADRRAYAAVLKARAAYEAANADGYGPALTEARAAISAILTAVRTR